MNYGATGWKTGLRMMCLQIVEVWLSCGRRRIDVGMICCVALQIVEVLLDSERIEIDICCVDG